MKSVWPLVLALIMLASMPAQSYSQVNTDYSLEGTGYGISAQETKDAAITLQLGPSKTTLQDGQFHLGDKVYSIKSLDLSFFKADKLFRISAVSSDDAAIKGTGRLVLSNQFGSIYQINGRITDDGFSEKIILYTILKQEKQQETIQQETIQQETLQEQTQAATDKKDVLLLIKHYNRVEWKNLYKFTVRTFDPVYNSLSEFDQSSGYLAGVDISAKITDPLGNIIKISNGTTQEFGYYGDSLVIPDNSRTGVYLLNVTASGQNFKTTSKELTFVVTPVSRDITTPPP